MHQKNSLTEIAQAIFTINRHAKTALQPKQLYDLKLKTIQKLLREKRAKKIGIHFSKQPKQSFQYSTTLINVGEYYFHIPAEKEDFKKLKHLGEQDANFRNPKTRMSLGQAKKIIYEYIDWQPRKQSHQKRNSHRKQTYPSSYFTASSLGQQDWFSMRNHRKRRP